MMRLELGKHILGTGYMFLDVRSKRAHTFYFTVKLRLKVMHL